MTEIKNIELRQTENALAELSNALLELGNLVDAKKNLLSEEKKKLLSENKEYNVTIQKPQGVRDISTDKAVVSITLDDETTKEIAEIPIETINLDSNYKAVAIGESSSRTTVIVKGTNSVLGGIDAEQIKATVDLNIDCSTDNHYSSCKNLAISI